MENPVAPSSANIGWRLETFIGVFIPLQVVVVALRFYARHLTVGKYDAGDGLITAALFGQIVAGGIAISSVKHAGVGQHTAYLLETDPKAVTTFFKYLVAISTWYATTEGLAKLAVCLLYKQIFPQRSIRIIINITMALLVGASVGGGLADLFGCIPFHAHWGSAAEQAANCINTEALFVWGSFPNIVTDVILLVVPIPIVWNLHTSMGVRVGLIITFLFGSIGLITSVLRFVAFYNKSSFIDPTYSGVELIIWTVCEPGTYLIASCLVVYRPLLDKLGIPMVTSNSSRGKSNPIPKYSTTRKRTAQCSDKSGADKSIGLGTMSNKGFSQLADEFEHDESLPKRNIGVTTTIDVEIV